MKNKTSSDKKEKTDEQFAKDILKEVMQDLIDNDLLPYVLTTDQLELISNHIEYHLNIYSMNLQRDIIVKRLGWRQKGVYDFCIEYRELTGNLPTPTIIMQKFKLNSRQNADSIMSTLRKKEIF